MDILNKEINLNNNFVLDQNFTANQLDQNFTANQLDQNFTTNQLNKNFSTNQLNKNFTTNQLNKNLKNDNKFNKESISMNKSNQYSITVTKSSDSDSTDIDEDDDKPCPICDEYFVEGEFWIMCDVCKIWYHSECEKVIESEADEIEEYHCKSCLPHHGPSKHNIQNNHRYDRTINDSNHSLPTQIGTTKFIEELKQNRKFKKLEKVYKKDGYDVTMDFLIENGFDRPILVENAEGLGMKIPKEFNFDILLDRLGDNYTVDVINVYRQETDPMRLIELVDALNNKERDDKSKILNCISLELSTTDLSAEIEPPYIVRNNLSWADNVYCDEDKPAVQKYLLLSMKDSYTDFHIDFSGTSVWYHIYRGSKIFYFIEPTERNIKAYEEWLVKENHSEIFFPDEIEDDCYCYELKQGDTMLLPAGWIHGVYTPDDSIVFGGNFLNIFRADLQIKIFELEERQETAEKFKFPAFKFTHSISVKFVYSFLRDLIKDNKLNKQLCKNKPRCKQLYDSFRSYLNFTEKYINEFDEETANSFEKEMLTRNGSKYKRLLGLMAKELDKINPYDTNNQKREIKKSNENGALNNSEDLPQKSVKLKSEGENNLNKRKCKESLIIDTTPKRRKNLIPLELKRSKEFSNKLIPSAKKFQKTDPVQLSGLISITNNQDLSHSPILISDDKKRRLNNAPLTNFRIPKKPKLIDSPKKDVQFNFISSNNSDQHNSIGEQHVSDDDWNDSLPENRTKLSTKLESKLLNDDDCESNMNAFKKINQFEEADKSIIDNANCNLSSMNKFEKSKEQHLEIKSNSSNSNCVYTSYDIRSISINKNPISQSDDKIDKPKNDSSNKEFEKSDGKINKPTNDLSSKQFEKLDDKINKPTNDSSSKQFEKSFDNDLQQLNNNQDCNPFNANKEDNRKSNYDSNYNNKHHYKNFSNNNYNNGRQHQQNNNNVSNGNNDNYRINQRQQNYSSNSNRNYNGNKRNYNSNSNNLNNNNNNNYYNNNHKGNYNRNNYQNNSNRNSNNNYINKRNYDGNNQFNNNYNSSISNNRSPNNNQSNKNYMDSNKYDYDSQSTVQSSTASEGTSSEFGSDW